MQFYEQIEIWRFFDVSIIIPVYDNPAAFKKMVTNNHSLLQRNGIEVIVVLNETCEGTAITDWLQQYYLINWKVIVCSNLQDVIQLAAHQYIMLINPGRLFFSDVIYQLRYILEHYKESVAVARETGVASDEEPDRGHIHEFDDPFYGSLMVHRDHIINLTAGVPPDIHNLIDSLELSGIRKMWVPQAVLLYERTVEERLPAQQVSDSNSRLEIRYDWQTSNVSAAHRQNYLNQFQQYDVFETDFNKQYPVICLMQVRNERHHLPEVLAHVQQYCDGIILLDDESCDGSYEAAMSEKLLLKVQKKYKGFFDDLENRNILLHLGHLFKAGWYFFIDADERFDERYADIMAITHLNDIDVACFRVVHLWNNESFYRKGLPRAGDGLLLRYRMFRNKGFTQIIANRELHFPAVPFTARAREVKILIKHYGLINEEIRQRKYHTYLKQDQKGEKQGHGYDYLLDVNCTLGKVDELYL